jgi:hypothetical protein
MLCRLQPLLWFNFMLGSHFNQLGFNHVCLTLQDRFLIVQSILLHFTANYRDENLRLTRSPAIRISPLSGVTCIDVHVTH